MNEIMLLAIQIAAIYILVLRLREIRSRSAMVEESVDLGRNSRYV